MEEKQLAESKDICGGVKISGERWEIRSSVKDFTHNRGARERWKRIIRAITKNEEECESRWIENSITITIVQLIKPEKEKVIRQAN